MNARNSIKIIVADDHAILKEGIAKLLDEYEDILVVGQATDGAQTIHLVEHHQPHVLVSDINMGKLNGYEVLQEIKTKNLATKVLFLTMHDKPDNIFKAMEMGASGYLTKDTIKEELIQAIRTINQGRVYFGQSIMKIIVDNRSQPGKEERVSDKFKNLLSAREIEILSLVSEGLSSKQISEKLFISERTVANHRLNIMNKCGVSNTVELVKMYLNYINAK
jgi:DNA-binding NarL/FixJ family response regulator